MKICELINIIEKDFPISSSMDYDNSGSNIVDFDKDITGILTTLDITLDCIEFAKSNNINFIISHHPLIFNKIQNLNDDPVAKRIKLLNKYDINAYSCHTNYDSNLINGMGYNLVKLLFENAEIKEHNILEKFSINGADYGIGNIIVFNEKKNFNDIKNLFINKLRLNSDEISFYLVKNDIKKVIIIPGSGSGDVELVLKEKPDLLITSDLKHNQILDLKESGISYFNATHYGLENIFIDSFCDYLSKVVDRNIIIKKFDINL